MRNLALRYYRFLCRRAYEAGKYGSSSELGLQALPWLLGFWAVGFGCAWLAPNSAALLAMLIPVGLGFVIVMGFFGTAAFRTARQRRALDAEAGVEES